MTGTDPRTVVMVTPSLGRGGAERHLVSMATSLDRTRWVPHVVTFADGPLRADLEASSVSVDVVEVGHGLSSLRPATRAVEQAVAQIEPDVLSGHDVLVELALRAEVRRRPRPLLIWKHTYGHVGYRGQRERLIERASQHLVERYGAVCHTQVRYLTDELGIDPTRVSVLANTVALREPRPLPSGPPTVAMVAAMRLDKGHTAAIRAWAGVVERVPAARLVLIGDGPLRPQLEALVDEMGLDAAIRFAGETADPQLLLADCHALLVASYTVECFPYAALEAMAMGRPVIATTVGGLPEMVEHGVSGWLVPPRDESALASALTHVLSDPDRLAALGAEARLKMERALPFRSWVDGVHALLDDVAAMTKSHGPTR